MLSEWFSITRTIGLTSYTVTLAVCSMRWIRSRQAGLQGKIFALLSCTQLILLLDMAFDWRWQLHEYWMRQAMVHGMYGERRGPQLLLLIALIAVLGICAVILLIRFWHEKGKALALTGTLLSVGLCGGEAVSYHDLDRIFHATVGGAMLVSYLWAFLCALTCLGIWIDARYAPYDFRD